MEFIGEAEPFSQGAEFVFGPQVDLGVGEAFDGLKSQKTHKCIAQGALHNG